MDLPIRRGGGSLERRRRPGWGLAGWDPFSEFEHLWNEMGRVFDRGAAPIGQEGSGAWMPMAEEEETDDAYLVRVELPGIPRENVAVDVGENELQISGELTEEHQGQVLARRAGRFFYRTSLPGGIDSEKAEAELTDGILRIRLPKSGPSKRHRISIAGEQKT